MDGKTVLNLLVEAGLLHPEVWKVNILAQSNGYLSIHADFYLSPDTTGIPEELDRLRLIEKLAAKMVKLQLEDGQVDDQLAEQVRALLDG